MRATSAPRCATRTSATAASAATANPSTSSVRDEATATATRNLIADQFPDLLVTTTPGWREFKLRATDQARGHAPQVQEQALKQNMVTLHNRDQRTGRGRAGDPAAGAGPHRGAAARRAGHRQGQGHPWAAPPRWKCAWWTRAPKRAGETGPRALGTERYLERNGQPVIVKKQVILTGENLTDAQPAFDGQTQEPTVNLTLDARAASSRTSRARTSASAWPSICSRRARARS